MAANKVTLGSYFGNIIVSDSSANATVQTNVTGAASTVYSVEIDNTANTGTTVYFKLFDNAAPQLATTAANFVLPVQGGKKLVYVANDGLTFANAVSYACVTGAATGNTTAPSSAVPVTIIAS